MEKGYSNKICGRQPLKNFSRSMFEYFIPYDVLLTLGMKGLKH